MSGVLNTVDARTNLVGENRLELLLFSLNSSQIFAINVFKVKEVIKVPVLTKMPGSHAHITGVASLRGEPVPVIDLRKAIGFPESRLENPEQNLIITEYNRSTQGFWLGRYVTLLTRLGQIFSRHQKRPVGQTTSQRLLK